MSDDPRAANYADVFDGHLAPGTRPALIVIDVGDAYLRPAAPLYAPSFVAALAVIERRVRTARRAEVPVIFTSVLYQKGGADGGLFYRKVPALRVFDAGSALRAFPPTVAPEGAEVVVTKQYASAFFGTSLGATLNAGRHDSVILTGFSTSGCVRATGLDALQNGFAPFVVATACADRHAAVHEANLFDLQSKYAEVIDEKAATDWMIGVSG